MRDYDHIRKLCHKSTQISSIVIDEFIMYYAAKRDKLIQEFDSRFSRFRHAGKDMPGSWLRMIQSQYVVHRIFKQGGLINKYLGHAAVKSLDDEQQNYLRQMSDHPWRFSFSEIQSNPAKDFYEMEDVFSGNTFLLYSTAVSQILTEQSVLLWFNLIANNGTCWQTYGPVSAFKGFDTNDIFFYATELNRSIESDEDLLREVENNPIPYMLLMTGSQLPLVFHREFEMVQVLGESKATVTNIQELKKTFRVEYAQDVYKLTHKTLSVHPHFAEAFIDEEQGILLLSALTDYGYKEMSKLLDDHECNLPVDPDIRVHLQMLVVIKRLLKKQLVLNPYSELFNINPSREETDLSAKLNELLSLALPIINTGKEPDIEAMAKQVGVDPDVAKEIIQRSMESINRLRNNAR